jgi:mucin-22
MSSRRKFSIPKFFRQSSRVASRPRARAGIFADGIGCEVLEGRVVLSGWGGDGGGGLIGSLAPLGIVPGAGEFGSFELGEHGGSPTTNSGLTQLQTDLTKLQTDTQAVTKASGTTIADLNALVNDSQALATAGFRVNATNLEKVTTELATAVAAGSDTTQAKTDFNALFTGSSVTQATIDTTFADLTQAITDSGITTAEITAISTDQTAVQTDLTALGGHHGFFGDDDGPLGIGFGLGGFEGGSLAASLDAAGVPTSLGSSSSFEGLGLSGFDHRGLWGATSAQITQLQTDVTKLQSDTQAVAAKSGTTVSDLSAIATDNQAIAAAGLRLNQTSLNKATAELATAVAAGSDTTQAKTDFNALFTGSSVTQATIDAAFTDLTKAIKDSGITTAQLTAIAADQTAIQTDLSAISTSSGHHDNDNDGDDTPLTPPATTGTTSSTGLGTTTTPAPIVTTPIPTGGLVATGTTTPTVATSIPTTPTTTATTVTTPTTTATVLPLATTVSTVTTPATTTTSTVTTPTTTTTTSSSNGSATSAATLMTAISTTTPKVSHAHAGTNRKFHAAHRRAKH